jgi:glutamine synthetase type III
LVGSTEEKKRFSGKNGKMYYSMGIKVKTRTGEVAPQLKAYAPMPEGHNHL